jgi:hypothetical protein
MSLFKCTILLCASVCAIEVMDRERKWSTLDEAHSFFPVVLLGSQSFFSQCNS